MQSVRLSAAAVVLSALVFAACSDDPDSSSSTSKVASERPAKRVLEKCPIVEGRGGGPSTAASWSGSVSGISCEVAGKLILREFVMDFDREVLGDFRYAKTAMTKSKPGIFESAGFLCRHEAHSEEDGWALRCGQGDKRMSFYLTP